MKNFKTKNASSSKPSVKIEEVVKKEFKEQIKKDKKMEENQILDKIRILQLQQQDTLQACNGWSEALLKGSVDINSKDVALAY